MPEVPFPEEGLEKRRPKRYLNIGSTHPHPRLEHHRNNPHAPGLPTGVDWRSPRWDTRSATDEDFGVPGYDGLFSESRVKRDKEGKFSTGAPLRSIGPYGRFKETDLDNMRNITKGLKSTDYPKLLPLIDGLSQSQLKQIHEAHIPYLSLLARNRITNGHRAEAADTHWASPSWDAEFAEADHPRGKLGRFVKGAGQKVKHWVETRAKPGELQKMQTGFGLSHEGLDLITKLTGKSPIVGAESLGKADQKIYQEHHYRSGSEVRKGIAGKLRSMLEASPEIIKDHLKEEAHELHGAARALNGLAHGETPTTDDRRALIRTGLHLLKAAAGLAMTSHGLPAMALVEHFGEHIVGEVIKSHARKAGAGALRFLTTPATAGADTAFDADPDDWDLIEVFLHDLAHAIEHVEIPEEMARSKLQKPARKPAEALSSESATSDRSIPRSPSSGPRRALASDTKRWRSPIWHKQGFHEDRVNRDKGGKFGHQWQSPRWKSSWDKAGDMESTGEAERADWDESAGDQERDGDRAADWSSSIADPAESTESRERAEDSERTGGAERAAPEKSTERSKRADLHESTEAVERTTTDAEFHEEDVNRDPEGKFATQAGGGKAPEPKPKGLAKQTRVDVMSYSHARKILESGATGPWPSLLQQAAEHMLENRNARKEDKDLARRRLAGETEAVLPTTGETRDPKKAWKAMPEAEKNKWIEKADRQARKAVAEHEFHAVEADPEFMQNMHLQPRAKHHPELEAKAKESGEKWAQMSEAERTKWFTDHPGKMRILDRRNKPPYDEPHMLAERSDGKFVLRHEIERVGKWPDYGFSYQWRNVGEYNTREEAQQELVNRTDPVILRDRWLKKEAQRLFEWETAQKQRAAEEAAKPKRELSPELKKLDDVKAKLDQRRREFADSLIEQHRTGKDLSDKQKDWIGKLTEMAEKPARTTEEKTAPVSKLVSAAGGKEWKPEGGDKHRVYFKGKYHDVYYDVTDGEFHARYGSGLSKEDIAIMGGELRKKAGIATDTGDWSSPKWNDNLTRHHDQLAPSAGPPLAARRRTSAEDIRRTALDMARAIVARDAEFKEEEHDRDQSGQFTSGGASKPPFAKSGAGEISSRHVEVMKRAGGKESRESGKHRVDFDPEALARIHGLEVNHGVPMIDGEPISAGRERMLRQNFSGGMYYDKDGFHSSTMHPSQLDGIAGKLAGYAQTPHEPRVSEPPAKPEPAIPQTPTPAPQEPKSEAQRLAQQYRQQAQAPGLSQTKKRQLLKAAAEWEARIPKASDGWTSPHWDSTAADWSSDWRPPNWDKKPKANDMALDNALRSQAMAIARRVTAANNSPRTAMAFDRALVTGALRSQTVRIAMDQTSVRTFSPDGHLHVALSNISRASVNPYWGKEIPDAEKLGLDPAKKYMLLRHPDELRKAAASFNGIPVLIDHKPISADDHPHQLVVGSTGTDARWEPPFLVNSLHIWDKAAIDGIQNSERRELSCAYHYQPVMQPGVWEGKTFDGIMTNIHGNHVALVEAGRVGPAAVVADAMPFDLKFHSWFGR